LATRGLWSISAFAGVELPGVTAFTVLCQVSLVALLTLCASSVTDFIGDGFGGVGVFSTHELCFVSAGFFVSLDELESEGIFGMVKCGQLTLPLGELSIQ
jgi:hypothetical protein